eukprot:ANDGO_00338.mRNA.1 Adenylate cyclase 1
MTKVTPVDVSGSKGRKDSVGSVSDPNRIQTPNTPVIGQFDDLENQGNLKETSSFRSDGLSSPRSANSSFYGTPMKKRRYSVNANQSAGDETKSPRPDGPHQVGAQDPTQGTRKKESRCKSFMRKLFSIRVLFVFVLVASIVTTGVVCWWLSFSTASDSVTTLASDLRSTIAMRVRERVQRKLEVLEQLAKQDKSYFENRNMSVLSYNDMLDLADNLWVNQMSTFGDDAPTVNVLGNENNEVVSLIKENSTSWIWNIKSATTNLTFQPFDNSLPKKGRELPPMLTLTGWNVKTKDWYLYGKVFGKKDGSISIAPVSFRNGGGTTEPSLYVPCGWKIQTFAIPGNTSSTGTLRGVAGKGLSMDSLSTYLSSVITSGYVYIFERTDAGLLIATSHGTISTGTARLSPTDLGYIAPPIVDATNYLRSKYGSFLGMPDSLSVTLTTGSSGQYFLETFRIRYLEADYVLVVMKSRDSIMQGIDEANRNTLIVVICIVVAATLLGVLLAHWIVKPLDKLGNNMRQLAVLNFEDGRSNATRKRNRVYLHEIHSLNESYKVMRTGIEAFSFYVPASLVKLILTQRVATGLGMDDVSLTVMFMDVKGFTQLSETLSPSELCEVMAEFLGEMSDIVMKHDGTIDKFIGDCIMAFWNAPVSVENHPRKALDAVGECVKRLKELQVGWAQRGLPQLDCRIGLNTGDCLVGNFGSHKRMAYTLVGKNANLASRLESLNKHFHTRTLIAEQTVREAGSLEGLQKDGIVMRPVGQVIVVGLTAPVLLYEILSPEEFPKESAIALAGIFTEALNAFYRREFAAARELFSRYMDSAKYIQAGYEDFLSMMYMKQCDRLRIQPPGPDWRGVIVMDEK